MYLAIVRLITVTKEIKHRVFVDNVFYYIP